MEEFGRACLNMMSGSGGGIMMLGMIVFWTTVLGLAIVAIRWIWLRSARRGAGRH